MYKTILVREVIEEGDKLLRELDRQRFPVQAALWYDDPDRMAWKLIVVSPVAGKPGSHEAYKGIMKALANLKGMTLSLDDVLVMSPESQSFRDLRTTIEGVSQMAASGQRVSLEGITFEDAYVYRWPFDLSFQQ